MRTNRSLISLLVATFLSGLLLIFLSAGWGLPLSQATLHAQEVEPANSNADDTSSVTAHNMELVSAIGGEIGALTVQGNYVYAGIGRRFVVLDVSQPTTPTLVGALLLPTQVLERSIVVENGYVYVANGEAGMRVIDVRDPTHPVEVGVYDIPGKAYAVAVADGYAYVIDGQGRGIVTNNQPQGVRIVDVGDPTKPVEISFVQIFNGRPIGVTVVGDYVYVVDYWHGVRIVDVKDPEAPVEVGGTVNLTGYASSVAVAGHYAYVGTEHSGMRVVDVADPRTPVEVGFYLYPSRSGYPVDVTVIGNYVYVADESLFIADISNPIVPVWVGVYDKTEVLDVYVSGDYAYLATRTPYRSDIIDVNPTDIHIVDVSDPTDPMGVGIYDELSRAWNVDGVGNYIYFTAGDDGLWVMDLSNPAQPAMTGIVHITEGAEDIVIAGDYAYVTTRNGMQVLDISDPSNPVADGYPSISLNFAGSIFGIGTGSIAAAGNYVYVSGGYWLSVVDVSSPTNPVVVGEYGAADLIFGIVVEGDYVYLANFRIGLVILDISTPSAPVKVGSLDSWHKPLGIAVNGEYAYLTDGEPWLHIVNVSDPTTPVSVGYYANSAPSALRNVDVIDGYVYVGGSSMLAVMDVSDPDAPIEIGLHYTPASDVFLAGDYIYVTDRYLGLNVLRYASTSYPVAGRVTNWDGAPLPGVELSVSPTQTAITDWAGNYTLSGLVTETYTITPTRAGYFFEPPSRTFSVPPLARGQDFAVSSTPIYAFGGGIYEDSFFGLLPTAEPVVLHLSNGAQTTIQDGFYTFADLPPGGYVVTPTLADFSFYPASRSLTIPPNTDIQDFIVVKDPTLNILGTIHQSNGQPFAGVQVEISQMPTTTRSLLRGAALRSTELGISTVPSTTTDAQGRYAFLNLEAGSYAVRAGLEGYLLLPVSRTAELPTLYEYPFLVLPEAVTGTVSAGVTTTLFLTDTQGLAMALTFPADAVGVSTTVTVTPQLMPNLPGHASAHHTFALELAPQTSRAPLLDFSQPVSLSVGYSISDSRAISDTGGIGLWWLGEGGWVKAEESCAPSSGQSHDETARVVYAAICRPGLYALAGPTYQYLFPWVNFLQP